jgi:hypothetical protein
MNVKEKLENPTRRWEDNIKVNIKEKECEQVHWNEQVENKSLSGIL